MGPALMMSLRLALVAVVLMPALGASAEHLRRGTATKEYFVDGTKGSDSNPGSLAQPFKTITHARDVIRQLKNSSGLPVGGVAVMVRGGEYSFLDGPFTLAAEDSGEKGSPIVYQSYPGDPPAQLTAGVAITVDMMEPVVDPSLLRLIPKHISDSVVQVDLRKLGITDFGELESGQLGNCANDKLEFFVPGKTMGLARYPNISPEGVWQFLQVSKVLDPQKSFQYTDSRISQWKNTSTLWLHGFWSFDWADNYVRVETVNATGSSFIIDNSTPPVYGFKTNARYYALNILEELDSLDEYYVDRGSGVLYLLAPSLKTQGCVSVGESVISMENVLYVQFSGFAINCARKDAIVATNASNVVLADMVVGHNGGRSATVSGYSNTISNVTVSDNGCGGISLSGGDQLSLTRGNNLLTRCTIHDWSQWKRTYQPGISWGGVGNNYTHNQIFSAPHAGILGAGNDCLFEYNNLSRLCYEVTDSGGFYSGRSWIDRGNVIRHSTFSHIVTTEKTYLGSPSVQAIYLDDQMSGYAIYNNTFFSCHVGSFIGGGRRNLVFNNTYRNCSTAVHVDNRGMGWQSADCADKPGAMFYEQLQSVHYQSPPWSTHYPELVGIYQDHPCVPVDNIVVNNLYCGGSFTDITSAQAKDWLITMIDNIQRC